MSEWKGTDLCSWEQFLERLEWLRGKRKKCPSTKVLSILYRGDRNPQRNLDTSLEREGLHVTFDQYFTRVTTICAEVESMSGRRWDVMPDETAYLGWIASLGDGSKAPRAPPGYEYLAYLRHHGFPSPLLDWSRSPYIAAYFAFSNADEGQKEPVSIYIYWEMGTGKNYGKLTEPLILSLGSHIRTHHRHFRQQSEYTFCVRQEENVELKFAPHDEAVTRCDGLPDSEVDAYIGQPSPDLAWKFNIPAREKWKVLSYLDEYNLNGLTLFGTEDELMKTLAMRAEIKRWRD